MVNRDSSTRYLGPTEGAPPVPPPGGYKMPRHGHIPLSHRDARSVAPPVPVASGWPLAELPDAPLAVGATGAAGREPKRSSAIGTIAVTVAAVFGFLLLIMMSLGRGDLIYGLTMFTLQLVVLGVVVAALAMRRSRMLGAIALTIALLFNVATLGGFAAVTAEATGTYSGQKSEQQRHWEAYPGVKDYADQGVDQQTSLEEVRAANAALLADVRKRLTEKYGYTWVKFAEEDVRHLRNGYGGESMLVEYTSEQWGTNEPIAGSTLKKQVMQEIDAVLTEYGMYDLYLLNGADSNIDPEVQRRLFGGVTIEDQPRWEAYSSDWKTRIWVDFHDSTADRTGTFLAERQAENQRTGAPVEGATLIMRTEGLLSEADREEYRERMAQY